MDISSMRRATKYLYIYRCIDVCMKYIYIAYIYIHMYTPSSRSLQARPEPCCTWLANGAELHPATPTKTIVCCFL